MMTNENIALTRELTSFIEKSPTAFQAIETLCAELTAAGFVRLSEGKAWDLHPGDKCFVTRNGSALLAFRLPTGTPERFQIIASHADSPTFQLKKECEADAFGRYVRLNTEKYGGTIYSTWFDRPLSIAGRVVVRENDRFAVKNVKVDRDLLVIPSVAIHLNHSANDGYRFNPAVDTLPLFGAADAKGSLKKIVADAAGVAPDAIASTELYLYNRTPASIFGANDEFFASPRIDNLQCAFGTLRGFISAATTAHGVQMLGVLDNEETGSLSKQGADSTFFADTVVRIAAFAGRDPREMLYGSFLVSADNAHAKHPNHPELSDAQNAPVMNGGVVIKFNANKKYTTDGVSEAIFAEICRRAEVPVQYYTNRSDLPGGSTLGNIANAHISLNTVDIGMAQLAMHSCYETAGCADTDYLIRASRAFFETSLVTDDEGGISLS